MRICNKSKIIIATSLIFSLLILLFSQNILSIVNNVKADGINVYLENYEVYYIKNQRSGLYLDVYNNETTNGTKLIQWNYNGQTNQKFKIIRYSTDVYYIIPMLVQSKRVDVEGAINANNQKIEIWDPNTSSAQKFKIIDDGNGTGSFKILTATSNYSKCVTVQGASYSAGASIIQYTYGDSGTNDNDHWYFEKCTTLTLYEQDECNIGRYSKNTFNLEFLDERELVNYVVETTGDRDTYLRLYQDGVLIDSNDDGGQGLNGYIMFEPPIQCNTTFKLEVTMYGSGVGNCNVIFRPEKDLYWNSYTDSTNDFEEIIEPSFYYMSYGYGYFINHLNNTSLSNMMSSTIFRSSKFNCDYYFISTTGNSSGFMQMRPGEYFTGYSLPDMSDCLFAVWACNYGGKIGNAADLSVNFANAETALGWPGLLYEDTLKHFTSELWYYIMMDNTIEQSIRNARSSTSNSFFWKSIFGWGDDSIMDCTLFTPSGSSIILASQPTITPIITTSTISLNENVINENIVIETDSFAADIIENNYEEANTIEFNDFKYNSDYEVFYGNDGVKKYVKKINGYLTNDYYIATNKKGKEKIYKSKNSIKNSDIYKINNSNENSNFTIAENIRKYGAEYTKQEIVIENDFYLKTNNDVKFVKRQQIKYINSEGFEYLDEIFIDQTTGEIIPIDLINTAF